MEPLPLSRIAEFAGATIESGQADAVITRISTDSRTLQQGELFVPIHGEKFDAHDFIEQVAERGAAGTLARRSWRGTTPAGFAVLRVDDTLAAYQAIAAGYRRSLPLKVVGITGSNGKTSTKDFMAAVLARRFRVTRTEGNLNNHVGVPRTVLEANSGHEVAVWEMGMNHPGEIAVLARIAAPDAGVITNIGIAHIEYMGSREAIAQEKGALAEAVGAAGVVILNADDPFSEAIAKRTRARVVFAGIDGGSLRATDIRQSADGSEFTVLEGAHRCRAQLPVPGLHMVRNALLAIAVGRAFGLSLEECAVGLASAPLTKARLQIREIGGVEFLDDSYNANPDSVKAALHTLAELDVSGRRIAVLGEMGELGAEAERGHAEVGETAAALRVDQLIAVGAMARATASAAEAAGLANVAHVPDVETAARLLSESTSAGDLVLVKGSRSAGMERVLETYAQAIAPAEAEVDR